VPAIQTPVSLLALLEAQLFAAVANDAPKAASGKAAKTPAFPELLSGLVEGRPAGGEQERKDTTEPDSPTAEQPVLPISVFTPPPPCNAEPPAVEPGVPEAAPIQMNPAASEARATPAAASLDIPLPAGEGSEVCAAPFAAERNDDPSKTHIRAAGEPATPEPRSAGRGASETDAIARPRLPFENQPAMPDSTARVETGQAADRFAKPYAPVEAAAVPFSDASQGRTEKVAGPAAQAPPVAQSEEESLPSAADAGVVPAQGAHPALEATATPRRSVEDVKRPDTAASTSASSYPTTIMRPKATETPAVERDAVRAAGTYAAEPPETEAGEVLLPPRECSPAAIPASRAANGPAPESAAGQVPPKPRESSEAAFPAPRVLNGPPPETEAGRVPVESRESSPAASSAVEASNAPTPEAAPPANSPAAPTPDPAPAEETTDPLPVQTARPRQSEPVPADTEPARQSVEPAVVDNRPAAERMEKPQQRAARAETAAEGPRPATVPSSSPAEAPPRDFRAVVTKQTQARGELQRFEPVQARRLPAEEPMSEPRITVPERDFRALRHADHVSAPAVAAASRESSFQVALEARLVPLSAEDAPHLRRAAAAVVSPQPKAAGRASAAEPPVRPAAKIEPAAERTEKTEPRPEAGRATRPEEEPQHSDPAPALAERGTEAPARQPAAAAPPDRIVAQAAPPPGEKAVEERPSAASAPPAPRAERTPEPPLPQPASPAAARDIRLELAQGERRVEVRLVDRGGDLHLAVRTPDQRLSGDIRENLPELSARLEHTGFRTEPLHSTPSSGDWSREVGQPAGARNSDSQAQPDERRGHGDPDRRQAHDFQEQQHRKQKRKDFEWLMASLR
jgi:hypothetical protein